MHRGGRGGGVWSGRIVVIRLLMSGLVELLELSWLVQLVRGYTDKSGVRKT